jgi:uncharacterized protein YabN with tetrapyrrole methylase and pyrophosphatase domain
MNPEVCIVHEKNDQLEIAWNLQIDAAKVGFDWPEIEGVFDKVLEEVEEVKDAWKGESREALELELGDLLFAVINLCRVMEVHPTNVLKGANSKFSKRFERMCEGLTKSGKDISNASLDEIESMWEWAKGLEY